MHFGPVFLESLNLSYVFQDALQHVRETVRQSMVSMVTEARPACAAPCPAGASKELPSAQALLHGREAGLAQGLDRRSLLMVLLVRRCC